MKTSLTPSPDLICLSHLRWNFVFQRPQHLMVRFARERRVFFVEEPIFDSDEPRLDLATNRGVRIVVPHLPPGTEDSQAVALQRRLLHFLMNGWRIDAPLLWLYTPIALPLVEDIHASAVVYDCMDELSGFAGASPEIREREAELMRRADVMFTGGHSLFEAKKDRHDNVHAFPSSVDLEHFTRARTWGMQPDDQRRIPKPRIGFCGVIDERMNLALVRDVAAAHPEWQFVMIGPVAKIDGHALPRGANLHYLGMKKYEELPGYLAGWDVAMMPFAHNDATRYISPTKTPEYLAAGCPVVSTSIRDVVRPYGERGLVQIADTAEQFGSALAHALTPAGRARARHADTLLSTMSWDRTWAGMNELIRRAETLRPSSRPMTQPAAAVTAGVSASL